MTLAFFLKPHYDPGPDLLKGDQLGQLGPKLRPIMPSDIGKRRREEEERLKLKLRENIELLIDGEAKIFKDGDLITQEDYEYILLFMMMEDC